jgi:hypothetical protein
VSWAGVHGAVVHDSLVCPHGEPLDEDGSGCGEVKLMDGLPDEEGLRAAGLL